MDQSRKENDAEHSWHLAVYAIFLLEYANSPSQVILLQALKMILIHDLVEIDAGDTYCYDLDGMKDKEEREQRAADRIFNILPKDQAKDLRVLWNEFEAGLTPTSQYARALDRFHPLWHNIKTDRKSWREHNVRKSTVLLRNQDIKIGCPKIWPEVERQIDLAVEAGDLLPE